MMVLCRVFWVRWSDYKLSVLDVSVCAYVCVPILVRLQPNNQTRQRAKEKEKGDERRGAKCVIVGI